MSKSLNVAMVAAEITPWAKVGGLADVIGALPPALAERGAAVSLVLPGYRGLLAKLGGEAIDEDFEVEVGTARERFVVRRATIGKVAVYLVDHTGYFGGRGGVYGEQGRDYADNLRRFVFFGRAAAAVLARLVKPEVVHAHDWHASVLPIVMRADPVLRPAFARTASLFTIHNLAFQGIFEPGDYPLLNLDWSYFTMECLEFFGRFNLMKGAVMLSDTASTVSPTYAREVTADHELGFGLEGVLRGRGDRFCGILNGADYDEWNPATDKFIKARYTPATPQGKAACAKALCELLEMPRQDNKPLVGMVSRMTPQKGFDLLADSLDAVMSTGIQFAILGSGPPAVEKLFKEAELRYPGALRVVIGFDNAVAHKIQAGCDMFLMPSRFEPCGLTQMYALKYGTPAVVRATGGLADTVSEFDPSSGAGNGFVFQGYRGDELTAALSRAVTVFHQPQAWQRLLNNCFAADFSWTRAADQYLALYGRISAQHRG